MLQNLVRYTLQCIQYSVDRFTLISSYGAGELQFALLQDSSQLTVEFSYQYLNLRST